MAPMPLPANGFLSLRTKFVLFFSLILVIACSTLSWYYVEERREAMTNNLQQLGTILLTSVVHNDTSDMRVSWRKIAPRSNNSLKASWLSRMWCMWSSPAQTEPCSLSTRREHANPLPALCGPWIILSTRTVRLRNSSSNRRTRLL